MIHVIAPRAINEVNGSVLTRISLHSFEYLRQMLILHHAYLLQGSLLVDGLVCQFLVAAGTARDRILG